MASLELVTNLKLISGNKNSVPTTTELPLGYMCFGVVNGQPSIWGNYDGTVRDLIKDGTIQINIVQATGNSTTDFMSQKAVTDALNQKVSNVQIVQTTGTDTTNLMSQKTTTDQLALKENLANKGKANGYAGLDNFAKLDPDYLPDYLLGSTIYGGTIAQNGIATLTATFKSRYNVSSDTLQLSAASGSLYEGVYFIAKSIFENSTVVGIPDVSTGDWLVANGNPSNSWDKIDNTDAVISVNGLRGAVSLNGSYIESINSFSLTRENIGIHENITESLCKIMKWYADFGKFAWQSQITATTDISGIVPEANLPIATASALGLTNVPASGGLKIAGGAVSVNAGAGISVIGNAVTADVVLKIGTI